MHARRAIAMDRSHCDTCQLDRMSTAGSHLQPDRSMYNARAGNGDVYGACSPPIRKPLVIESF